MHNPTVGKEQELNTLNLTPCAPDCGYFKEAKLEDDLGAQVSGDTDMIRSIRELAVGRIYSFIYSKVPHIQP